MAKKLWILQTVIEIVVYADEQQDALDVAEVEKRNILRNETDDLDWDATEVGPVIIRGKNWGTNLPTEWKDAIPYGEDERTCSQLLPVIASDEEQERLEDHAALGEEATGVLFGVEPTP